MDTSTLYSALNAVLPFLMGFIVLYFVGLRPQQHKMKLHQAMLEAIKRGDHVVTAGGLIGVVDRTEDQAVYITIADGVVVACRKAQILEVNPSGQSQINQSVQTQEQNFRQKIGQTLSGKNKKKSMGGRAKS